MIEVAWMSKMAQGAALAVLLLSIGGCVSQPYLTASEEYGLSSHGAVRQDVADDPPRVPLFDQANVGAAALLQLLAPAPSPGLRPSR